MSVLLEYNSPVFLRIRNSNNCFNTYSIMFNKCKSRDCHIKTLDKFIWMSLQYNWKNILLIYLLVELKFIKLDYNSCIIIQGYCIIILLCYIEYHIHHNKFVVLKLYMTWTNHIFTIAINCWYRYFVLSILCCTFERSDVNMHGVKATSIDHIR